jgi:hypothetical protein
MTNIPNDLPTNTIYFKDLSNGYQVAIVKGEQHGRPAMLIPVVIAVAVVFIVLWIARRRKVS